MTPRATARCVLATALGLGLTGCGSLVDVRTVATGRADVAAYELRGTDLAPLKREAQRLCPQGADILRAAGRDQRPERDDTRLRRWASLAGEWIDPPQREAQLLLVCKDAPGGSLVPSVEQSAAAEAAARAAKAAPPIGPLNIEW